MRKNSGLFITFEGSEGSGKTTQIGQLSERLTKAGREVLVTREPGGTAIGETIRHLLKHDHNGAAMFPETELLLFAASRAQLVREVIDPALLLGKTILCDRYLDSTTVYQGVARRISQDPVQMINRFAIGNRMPHLTFVIDVPASVGMARVKQRTSDISDRMERENIEFYDAVREGYLLLAKNLPERFVVVDGTKPMADVAQAIWEQLCFRLSLTGMPCGGCNE